MPSPRTLDGIGPTRPTGRRGVRGKSLSQDGRAYLIHISPLFNSRMANPRPTGLLTGALQYTSDYCPLLVYSRRGRFVSRRHIMFTADPTLSLDGRPTITLRLMGRSILRFPSHSTPSLAPLHRRGGWMECRGTPVLLEEGDAARHTTRTQATLLGLLCP